MPAMTPERIAIIEHIFAGGKNPGGHRTNAWRRWRRNLTENNSILKEVGKDEARAAKRKLEQDASDWGVRESPTMELERLRRQGYVKGSAYRRGFMDKLAQMSQTYTDTSPTPNRAAHGPYNTDAPPAAMHMMRRPPRTSALKPSILYNRRSLYARLRRP